MTQHREAPRYTPRNTDELRNILGQPERTAFALPLWKFSAGGAVQRELAQVPARHLQMLYTGTRDFRDEIDVRSTSATTRDTEFADRLEMARRATAFALTRRNLAESRRTVADARPLKSEAAARLDPVYRLDPGEHIANGDTAKHANLLDRQRRGFFGRLLNRSYTVAGVEVSDADGVLINGTRRARLHGIDGPEWNEPGGRAATEHLRKLLGAGPLRVRERGHDRHNRLLVELHAGDVNVNERMVADGYARAYRRYSSAYIAQERKARRHRAGLWQNGDMPHPETFRHGKSAEI